MEKILTLHEAAELGYNEKIYHDIWDKSSFFTSQERLYIEEHMLSYIIEMYACVVDRLNILDKIKKFDYDIENDLIFVHLIDESKVQLPLTPEDIKNYTYYPLMAVNNIAELIKHYDKKRFKRKLSSLQKRYWYFYVLFATGNKQDINKTLTLHETVELGYEEEIYHDIWKNSSFFKNPELFDVEDIMTSHIIEMYACVVDRLNILDKIKKFDYDIENDLIFVHLIDESKVQLPLTPEDIKNYTYYPLMAVNNIAELIKHYDKKRFKRKLSSCNKRYWYDFVLFAIGKNQNTEDADPAVLTDELKSYYKSLERLDEQVGVETDRHYYQLNENEQIAEDLFNLGFNAIQYMGLSNIKYIKCTWDDESLSEYEYQLYAVLNNDEKIELNLSNSNKEYDEERHMEIDSLMYENNTKKRKNKISSIVETESIKFFNKEDCIFKTDKVDC